MNKQNDGSLKGKTVAVSGSTGGIGRELCLSLVSMGASLVLIDRNPTKVSVLRAELEAAAPGVSIKHVRADLEDFGSVRLAADELAALPIDFLVLCAGAYHIPRQVCDTGHDNIFQINFLAPYYIARRLLPTVSARGGRIVAVGSLSYRFARLSDADPEGLRYRAASKAYGNAKRCLMFALSRLGGDSGTVSVAHPGISPTGITGGYPKIIQALIKYPMKLIFMSPKKASACVLDGLLTPCSEGEWIGPRLLGIWGRPKKSPIAGYSSSEADHAIEIAEME